MMNQFDYDCYACDYYDRDVKQCTKPSIDMDYTCHIYAHNMKLGDENPDKEEVIDNAR